MIIIPVVFTDVIEIDETGAQVAGQTGAPALPIPSNAVRVECDNVNYTVYEQGDIIPSPLVGEG